MDYEYDEADLDRQLRAMHKRIAQAKREDYLVQYFVNFRYDLPEAGRFADPIAARDYFLNALPTEVFYGTWCFENKKKNGDPCKPHIHVHIACHIDSQRYPTWEKFKAGIQNHFNALIMHEGRKQVRGKASGFIWREGKPAVYAMKNCATVRDELGFYRYCLKWAPEDSDLHEFFVNEDRFRDHYPEYNVQAERQIAATLRQESAERSKKFQETKDRKSTCQAIMEAVQDIEFSNIREIYDEVIKYHIEGDLTHNAGKIATIVTTIAVKRELLSRDEYYQMMMKKM